MKHFTHSRCERMEKEQNQQVIANQVLEEKCTGIEWKFPNIQVIPGNLKKYISTSRSLLQCKTLWAHFSNNMMAYCLLTLFGLGGGGQTGPLRIFAKYLKNG